MVFIFKFPVLLNKCIISYLFCGCLCIVTFFNDDILITTRKKHHNEINNGIKYEIKQYILKNQTLPLVYRRTDTIIFSQIRNHNICMFAKGKEWRKKPYTKHAHLTPHYRKQVTWQSAIRNVRRAHNSLSAILYV